LSDHPIVFSMRADPEPNQPTIHLNGKRAVAQAKADRPEAPSLLEAQGRMLRIAPEQRNSRT
jgi:hypothetical protein